ncbi:hypothetical protein KIPB_001773 [Kipferlia bialata]|uniref:Uncharacterized protein n=1 Tax=Kipferlia bialata TaxID=797122 RepID=A0A9K3CPE3_9EUKA|nr:hypothetical protein KIPB_001773 [Kipferlia bialata]|eukprot:g1773.t1
MAHEGEHTYEVNGWIRVSLVSSYDPSRGEGLTALTLYNLTAFQLYGTFSYMSASTGMTMEDRPVIQTFVLDKHTSTEYRGSSRLRIVGPPSIVLHSMRLFERVGVAQTAVDRWAGPPKPSVSGGGQGGGDYGGMYTRASQGLASSTPTSDQHRYSIGVGPPYSVSGASGAKGTPALPHMRNVFGVIRSSRAFLASQGAVDPSDGSQTRRRESVGMGTPDRVYRARTGERGSRGDWDSPRRSEVSPFTPPNAVGWDNGPSTMGRRGTVSAVGVDGRHEGRSLSVPHRRDSRGMAHSHVGHGLVRHGTMPVGGPIPSLRHQGRGGGTEARGAVGGWDWEQPVSSLGERGTYSGMGERHSISSRPSRLAATPVRVDKALNLSSVSADADYLGGRLPGADSLLRRDSSSTSIGIGGGRRGRERDRERERVRGRQDAVLVDQLLHNATSLEDTDGDTDRQDSQGGERDAAAIRARERRAAILAERRLRLRDTTEVAVYQVGDGVRSSALPKTRTEPAVEAGPPLRVCGYARDESGQEVLQCQREGEGGKGVGSVFLVDPYHVEAVASVRERRWLNVVLGETRRLYKQMATDKHVRPPSPSRLSPLYTLVKGARVPLCALCVVLCILAMWSSTGTVSDSNVDTLTAGFGSALPVVQALCLVVFGLVCVCGTLTSRIRLSQTGCVGSTPGCHALHPSTPSGTDTPDMDRRDRAAIGLEEAVGGGESPRGAGACPPMSSLSTHDMGVYSHMCLDVLCALAKRHPTSDSIVSLTHKAQGAIARVVGRAHTKGQQHAHRQRTRVARGGVLLGTCLGVSLCVWYAGSASCLSLQGICEETEAVGVLSLPVCQAWLRPVLFLCCLVLGGLAVRSFRRHPPPAALPTCPRIPREVLGAVLLPDDDPSPFACSGRGVLGVFLLAMGGMVMALRGTYVAANTDVTTLSSLKPTWVQALVFPVSDASSAVPDVVSATSSATATLLAGVCVWLLTLGTVSMVLWCMGSQYMGARRARHIMDRYCLAEEDDSETTPQSRSRIPLTTLVLRVLSAHTVASLSGVYVQEDTDGMVDQQSPEVAQCVHAVTGILRDATTRLSCSVYVPGSLPSFYLCGVGGVVGWGLASWLVALYSVQTDVTMVWAVCVCIALGCVALPLLGRSAVPPFPCPLPEASDPGFNPSTRARRREREKEREKRRQKRALARQHQPDPASDAAEGGSLEGGSLFSPASPAESPHSTHTHALPIPAVPSSGGVPPLDMVLDLAVSSDRRQAAHALADTLSHTLVAHTHAYIGASAMWPVLVTMGMVLAVPPALYLCTLPIPLLRDSVSTLFSEYASECGTSDLGGALSTLVCGGVSSVWWGVCLAVGSGLVLVGLRLRSAVPPVPPPPSRSVSVVERQAGWERGTLYQRACLLASKIYPSTRSPGLVSPDHMYLVRRGVVCAMVVLTVGVGYVCACLLATLSMGPSSMADSDMPFASLAHSLGPSLLSLPASPSASASDAWVCIVCLWCLGLSLSSLSLLSLLCLCIVRVAACLRHPFSPTYAKVCKRLDAALR